MSNAEPEERVTASSDGVTVEKSFEPDDFPVPAIAFVIRSEREETVAVRMVDSVPEHVTPEDIGFHPKYGAEFWGVDGDAIVFEREFEPGEEYTTVYGLRGGDSDDVEKYMTDPVLETVHPPLEEGEDSEDVVRDVIEGEEEPEDDTESADDAESSPETDTEAHDDIESAIREADTDGASADTEAEESSEPTEPESEPGHDDGTAAAVAGGSLAAALAAEIRDGEVDDDDLEELRDALGVEIDAGGATDSGGAVDARIERLQSEVADLQAYTDALESFLDENGDAQTLIEEFRTELDEAVERVDGVDDRVDSTLQKVETRVEEATDEIEETIEETIEERVADHIEELRSDIEALEQQVEDGVDDERLDAIESDISDIEDELSDVSEMRERLTAAFGAPSDDE
jgi:archaellum component FlaC